MIFNSRTLYQKLILTPIAAFFLTSSLVSVAHAELSVGLQAGLTDFTTRLRGDAIYVYGGNTNNSLGYYQYPSDYNTTNGLAGIFARYVYPMSPCLSLGIETGYSYWGINYTRLRNDDNFAGNTNPTPALPVEQFTTMSRGLITLNAVLKMQLVPNVSFNIFAGPAWLDTQYKDNDTFDHFVRSLGSQYQLTADTGAEAEWAFDPDWSASMRFDYIYDTRSRTISTTGFNNLPLLVNNTAKSGAVLYSFTLRYLIPGT